MSNSNTSDYIFDTVDPLNQQVYLTKERWNEHILENHIELIGEEDSVKKTIEEPESIYKDKDFNSYQVYFRQHAQVEISSYGKYIKIVVDRNLQGQIVTAFCTPKGRENTTKIYP